MRHYDEKIMDILGGLFFSQESQPNRIVMEPNPNVYDSDMTLA